MVSVAKRETREQSLQHCLVEMDALANELRQAIRAIAGNALSSLEQSVRRQEERSAKLDLALLHLQEKDNLPESRSATPVWDIRLRKAAQALCGLNEEYAALLDHSGRSLRMLQSLHRQETLAESGLQIPQSRYERNQMWSWEG